jgi:hypothetical protein
MPAKGGFRIVQEQQVLLVTVADEPGRRPASSSASRPPHQHQVQLSRTGNRLVIAANDTQRPSTC